MDPVNILNTTPYNASGEVSYIACSHDDYSTTGGGGTWTAGSRGVCLLTGISATLFVNGNSVTATPYKSAGTTYSQFMIVETTPGSFTIVSTVDFSSYVSIINNTGNAMQLSGTPSAGSYDSYLVSPASTINPNGGQTSLQVVSSSSLAGTDGSCSYIVQNVQGAIGTLTFNYACPWSKNPNVATAIWNGTPLEGITIQVIPNPVPQWGHPLYAQFTIIQS